MLARPAQFLLPAPTGEARSLARIRRPLGACGNTGPAA